MASVAEPSLKWICILLAIERLSASWYSLEYLLSSLIIISKVGELNNPADRDHCLQYMVAIGLLKGDLVCLLYTSPSPRD